MLSWIPSIAIIRKIKEPERMEYYVRILDNYMDTDMIPEAMLTCGKAQKVSTKARRNNEKIPIEIELKFKFLYTRLMDTNRKFLAAASIYYELSQSTIIKPEDIPRLIENAIRSCIIGPAGPQKSRILGLLYKDDRVKTSPYYSILEKMLMEKVISKKEIEAFENSLEPHQKTKYPDGYTILEKALLENNIVSISKLYKAISITGLSDALSLSQSQAEKLISSMIFEKRLNAKIDQLSGTISFLQEGDVVTNFSKQVTSICRSLEEFLIEASSLHSKK